MKRIDTMALSLLAASSLAYAATPGTVAGRFPTGERYQAPETHAPAQISRAFVKTIPVVAGRAEIDVPAEGGTSILIWTMPVARSRRAMARDTESASLKTTLATPSGAGLEAGDSGSLEKGLRRIAFSGSELADLGFELPEAQEVLHVARAESGSYRVTIDAAGAPAVTLVAAETGSPRTLATWASPLSRQPGEPVTLHAELRDGASPLDGEARVTARLAGANGAGREILLAARGAGVFEATVSDLPEESGLISVRFEAEGRDGHGHAFLRTGSAGFVSEPGSARLLKEGLAARFVNKGESRVLRVSGRARVSAAGDYRLDVVVAGARSVDGARPSLAWAESTIHLDRGTASLSLDVPAGDLTETAGLLVDVRLVGLDTIGVAGRAELEVTGD